MSIEHLHYAIKEIDTVSQLLAIENSTFYKRSLTRLIANRTDDFIKLGFVVNKQTLKKKKIKDSLNALESLYKEYLKILRDKYGAHFQHLDFSDRLQFWSELNLEKASFFSNIPLEIYADFSGVENYIPYSSLNFDTNTMQAIEAVNEQFDLEKFPSLSTDILSLTRPNTGGILNFSMIHTKAGVLKSLELLIDYELAQIEAIMDNSEARRIFIKLFIIDLLSYVDNYFTRTDIADSAPQFEEGLDCYIAENVNDGTDEGHNILKQFKESFKLQEHINELRLIRNKSCGHIDIEICITDIDNMVDTFNLPKFQQFYLRLKDVFRSICHSINYLKQYLFDPFLRLHREVSINGIEVSSFDGKPFPKTVIQAKSRNDVQEYERQFKLWMNLEDGEAKSYFWDCFIQSEVLEKIPVETPLDNKSFRYDNYEYRKVHYFFECRLKDANVPFEEKIAILNLFVSCRNGHPDLLAFILERTYPKEISLEIHYIFALGKLSHRRTSLTLDRFSTMVRNGNIQAKCLTLRAILGIDIAARRRTNGVHDSDPSKYSDYLKTTIEAVDNQFEKLILSLALLSDFVFGAHFISESLNGLYRDYFELNILSATREVLISNDEKDLKMELEDFSKVISDNRFITFVGLLSDLIHEQGKTHQAALLRDLTVTDYISGARNDNQELHNFAVLSFKTGDLVNAISIAKFLTQKNAHQANHNYLLLELYRHDVKYKADFDRLKEMVLQTFNLPHDERLQFESLTMDV